MKKIELALTRIFDDQKARMFLVHDSPYFKIINFNFRAGQTLPIHSHEVEGQLSILVLEGNGKFLAADNKSMPAETGDVLISDIATPHGVQAETDMRILVTIAPPI
jgi:quercetin dioxygenase-like cupin family protein